MSCHYNDWKRLFPLTMGATLILYLRLESVIIETSFTQHQCINHLYYYYYYCTLYGAAR
jgi:hypothetical protein